MLPTSTCPVFSAVYSAESSVNGTNLIAASFGFTGPEYDVFGTIVTWPSVLKEDSFHGPLTTSQIGLEAYVPASFDLGGQERVDRLALGPVVAAVSVAQPPLPALAPSLVTSQAAASGVISASWL